MGLSHAKRRGRPVSESAAYRTVAGSIREGMVQGRWPQGAVLPSIRQLAKEFQVGERVVRLAIATLKDECRIRATPRRRFKVLSPTGAITTTTGIVLEVMGGNLHTFLQSSSVSDIQRGLEFGVGDLWAPLLIVHDEHLRSALPEELLDYSLRGIVLLGQFQNKLLRQYERLNIPVVLADRPGEHWKMHAVSVDNVTAAMDATRRLIALGHRQLAFLRFVQLGTRDIDPDSRERQVGFERACQEAGLASKNRLILNSFPKDGGNSASLSALFERRPQITAVLCSDPSRASLVLEAAKIRGKLIPRDLSVAAFQSEKPELPDISGPRINFFSLGRMAALLSGCARRPIKHQRVAAMWCDGKSICPARV
ncbi:MAG: substrate-binding domain-containing protein [Planctomycetota bacterium]|nr:substrate-binding domain-containing protein [Planctomycetota bacterium]